MTPAPLRILVVGFGPVAARLVDELLPGVRTGAVAVTVIGTETVDAYNRVLVAEYAVGATTLDAMSVADSSELAADGVEVLRGATVVAVDRELQTVTLHDDRVLGYDRLVLATGARANVPTLDGVQRRRRDLGTLTRTDHAHIADDDELPEGVTVLRDLADADRVLAAVRERRRIVVLGAGVLGLEFALAAAHHGAEVCVVHHGGHPMPRNVDKAGGSVLREAVRASGVAVISHSRAEGISVHLGDDGTPRFDALITADGKQVRGELLVLSCGVSPRIELAVLAGLRTATGVVVDRELRSWTDPNVSAIGDCAQVVERTEANETAEHLGGAPSGLIGPGWRQASWLAARLLAEAAGAASAGDLAEEREPIVMLKAEHVDLVAVGDVFPDAWDTLGADGPRVAQWADPEHLRYAKMVTRDGVLTGFLAVGMPRTAAELTLLYERGDELPADRSLLLRFDGPDYDPAADASAFAPTTTVCWCNAVTVGRIEEAASCGATTVECVGRDTRAGTGCGGCKGRIAEVLARFSEQDGTPAPTV